MVEDNRENNITAHKPEKFRIPKDLMPVVMTGIGAQIMDTMTTGAILVGFALFYGAPNIIIGFIGAVPFLTNLFQIPAIFLVEKFRARKKLVISASLLGRLSLLPIVFLPLIKSESLSLAVLLASMTFRYIFGAIATCGWNSWLKDVIPMEILGKFFARRMFYMTIVAAIMGMGAAFILDWYTSNKPERLVSAYSVVFLIGFLGGAMGNYFASRIPEITMAKREAREFQRILDWSKLKMPFKQPNFRKLMWFMCSWNFAVNMATPFFSAFMLSTLGYSLKFVILITLFSQAITALSFNLWGRYADRFSQKTVMAVCGTLFVFCFLGWTFVTFPDKHRFTTLLLFILHFIMGISAAGVNLATNNIVLKLAPDTQATSFLAVNSLMNSLAAGIAPLIGGSFADYFSNKQLSMEIRWQDPATDLVIRTLSINSWDFFFLVAFGVGVYALHRLTAVQEEGEIPHSVLVKEFMMDASKRLRTITSVDGLRDIVTSPFTLIYNISKSKSTSKKAAKTNKTTPEDTA